MKLRLERDDVTRGGTHGHLYIDHTLLCVTLENPPGAEKGAIPLGVYPISLDYSPRFRMLLPELRAVPGFTEILIHAGNTEKDTLGCILVGTYRVDDDSIAQSRDALGKVLQRWRDWNDDRIEIVGAR